MGAVAFFAVAAAYYLLTGIGAIANLAFPQLMADQYRFYPNYILRPFPDNALQLENGHRPILPALVRVWELRSFEGSLKLQIVVGAFLAILAVALTALAVLRQRSWPASVRAAGVAFSCIAVFWLANARMLLHSNEMVPVYLVIASLVLGAWAVHRATVSGETLWMWGAGLAAAAATFSFGTGVACFAAFACIAWMSGVSWRGLLPLAVTAGLCMVAYLVLLPGDQGVRQSLQLRPVENFTIAARWLASPWIHAWFGMADPPMNASLAGAQSSRRIAGLLASSATQIQNVLHLPWRGAGAVFTGAVGLIVLTGQVLWGVWHRRKLDRVAILAYTFMLFGAASALLIGMGRLAYFEQHPEQIFADRYLVWPCLFWLGLGLLTLSWSTRLSGPARAVIVLLAAAVPIVVAPTHRSAASWAAALYEGNAATEAAALSDVIDPRIFPDHRPDASLEERIATLKLMQQKRLGMFASPYAALLGRHLSPLRASSGEATVRIVDLEPVEDARDRRPAARVRGIVASGIAYVADAGGLVVVDEAGGVRGFAAFTRFDDGGGAIRLSVPRKRGFTAYVRDYDPRVRYRLVRVDREGTSGLVLTELPGFERPETPSPSAHNEASHASSDPSSTPSNRYVLR
ncbi:MAG TPA: hypothetical protein VMR06_12330 [Dokdonella sp.]|uniref:hypothetical protein n=1 Tax=Dokdonella sp. TaxID=2291710 RepID=UPI002CF95B26|nr:hypothetical protein [Dokdonella sp.]HUD42768.1 hypothetical protein [Dokdonella sp.]